LGGLGSFGLTEPALANCGVTASVSIAGGTYAIFLHELSARSVLIVHRFFLIHQLAHELSSYMRLSFFSRWYLYNGTGPDSPWSEKFEAASAKYPASTRRVRFSHRANAGAQRPFLGHIRAALLMPMV